MLVLFIISYFVVVDVVELLQLPIKFLKQTRFSNHEFYLILFFYIVKVTLNFLFIT
jgi:hypothetical protein